jgi:CHAT domain-containing protein/Tfp pilus assembly protein PilF
MHKADSCPPWYAGRKGRIALLLTAGFGLFGMPGSVRAQAPVLTPERRIQLGLKCMLLIAQADLLSRAGQYADAVKPAEQVLALQRQLYPATSYPDGHPELAASLNRLGGLLHTQGEYARALPYWEQALAMAEKLYPPERYSRGHHNLGACLNNLGVLLQARGEYAQALPYYERALAMNEKLYPPERCPEGHPDLAHALNNLGFLWHCRGEYPRAQPYYEGALAIRERLYPPARFPDGYPDLANSLNNLGGLLQARGEYARAQLCFERAVAMNEKLYRPGRFPAGHPDLAETVDNLGVLLWARGEYAQAQPYLERALAMNENLYPAERFPDGHPNLAVNLSNLGDLLRARGEPARAQPYYERALALSQRQGDRLAGGAAEAEALSFLRRLPPTRDSYLSVTRQLPDTAAATYARLWPGRSAVTRLLERRHLALLAARDRPEVRTRWEELGAVRRQLVRLVLAANRPPGAEDALRTLTARKERLERELAERLPPLAAQQALEGRGPADLQAQLPARTAFIDLVRYTHVEQDPRRPGLTGERRTPCYVAFVLAPGRPVQRVDLGDAGPIEHALEAWRQAIADRRDGPGADELRRRVWEPLAAQLPAEVPAVYLAVDGPLARLPWAALPGRRPGTVLLEDHAVAIVPHGPFLLGQLAARGKPTDDPGTVLAVGGVAYDDAPAERPKAVAALRDTRRPDRSGRPGAWQPLPGTRKEITRLQALAGAAVRRLEGTGASTARVTAELPRARLAHLATHGFFDAQLLEEERRLEQQQLRHWHFDPGRPTEASGQGARNPLAFCGLVLAGANRPPADDPCVLTGEALVGLPLENLEVAVLSACQTGLGDTADQECARNLQNAFHLAGCRNVVASLWDVPDQATAALMAVFYDELLRQKKPPLEALRQAQLTVYRRPGQLRELAERGPVRVKQAPPGATTDSARAAAKDWAGFVLSGLGR